MRILTTAVLLLLLVQIVPSTTIKITIIKNGGGRLDWSKNDVIAFDQLGSDNYYDVYTMNPDGSNEQCLTCGQASLPDRHLGNPAWYPSGDYIVFQAEQSGAPRNDITDYFANPGSGINNDLWIMDKSATRFWQLVHVPVMVGGTLHPHFSPDGNKLLWSERISSTGGEIGQWVLKVGDFSVSNGTPVLSNTKIYKPGQQQSFYESSSFRDGHTVLFSGNLETGQTLENMDVYTLDLVDGSLKNLTNTLDQWDEHAQASPQGDIIVWMSSVGVGGRVASAHPLTDYWMMRSDGSEKKQITYFNDPMHAEYVGWNGATAADSSWNPDGTKLMGYVILSQTTGAAQTVMIEFQTPATPGQVRIVK
jgi:Tol biopolymer transport system component